MKNKKAENLILITGSILLFIFFVFSIMLMAEPERFYSLPNRVITSETENTTTVNLCVTKKVQLPGGMTGLFSSYYLVLSNDMTVSVTRQNYEEYEVDKYYDFELSEKTTVTQRIKIRSN